MLAIKRSKAERERMRERERVNRTSKINVTKLLFELDVPSRLIINSIACVGYKESKAERV